MSLEKEYERPRQGNKPEICQKIIINFLRYNFKSMYPGKYLVLCALQSRM